jgi:hypothetical protein
VFGVLTGLPTAREGQSPARAQHAGCLIQSLAPTGTVEMLDGEVADDRVDALVGQRRSVMSAVCNSMRSATVSSWHWPEWCHFAGC